MTFVVAFNKFYESSNFVLFIQNCFGYLEDLTIPYESKG
jgi:hypothetical protein